MECGNGRWLRDFKAWGSIPDRLKIVQRGAKLEHFEIVPEYEMSLEEFQNLLNQIEISGPH